MVAREESGKVIDARRRARLFLESLPPERYPRLVEAATPLSEGVDPDTYFAFGLDLLLAGIEAIAARKRQGWTYRCVSRTPNSDTDPPGR